MGETPGALERYLDRLAQGLEALGPDEATDVVTEVRAHLAEALADAGGDEDAALARFGTSDALVTRILEERGILSAGSRVPEAPGRLRLGALAADVSLWLAILAIVLIPLVGIPMFVGTPSVVVVALAWTALAVAVMGSGWWLVKRWCRPGSATMGMRLAGVRRIRLGETTRIVRWRDVPGSPAGRRLWPLLATALAVFVLASFAASLNDGSLVRSRMSNAVHDASVGQSIVEDLY